MTIFQHGTSVTKQVAAVPEHWALPSSVGDAGSRGLTRGATTALQLPLAAKRRTCQVLHSNKTQLTQSVSVIKELLTIL